MAEQMNTMMHEDLNEKAQIAPSITHDGED
jgi:hypothetical protein